MVRQRLERSAGPVHASGDGFYTADRSLGELLTARGIRSLPGERGELPCDRYYDDWYLFALEEGIWGLFKMREQENDGFDGDDPGVTVSFISLDEDRLFRCLENPDGENILALSQELDKVTAKRGQRHSEGLKRYFLNPQSQGAYLIAALYVRKLAALAREQVLPLPRNCQALLKTRGGRRLARFLRENNRSAGREIFQEDGIHLADAAHLTDAERLALLAVHTGNTSLHSFAAEVRFHAWFLRGVFTLPGLAQSVYASAIRADMGIHSREFGLFCPYYYPKSRWVRIQEKHHRQP